jgi:predicted amidohydrolase YtcJ
MTFDVVIRGGAVFDGTRYRPEFSAVAISAGKIAAVGTDALADDANAGTEIIDAHGGLILPGFVDAHVHPVEGGLDRLRCDLTGAQTRDEYLERIANYGQENPNLEWILGGGWKMAAFPGGTPEARDLDRIEPNRPVYLPNRDHHSSWVNSRALHIAGITRDTPDPEDGRIERDRDGNPTGTLHEGAMNLVKYLIPEDSDDERYRALLEAQQYFQSCGITGWQDAIVGEYGGHSDTRSVYRRVDENGELTARVTAALWWHRDGGLAQLESLQAQRDEYSSDRFRASTIKIMQDGVPENHTAALLEPYLANTCQCAGDHRGIAMLDAEQLHEIVPVLDADNWQVHIHAIGDRAVRDSLDALELARRRNGVTDNRHHLAHLQIVHPDDIARFAELGVTANLQMLWATYEPQMIELNLPVLGPERSSWQYPFADLWRSGARLAAGSDWPVSTPNPWEALHVAVNRTLPTDAVDYNPKPFIADQAIGLDVALAAYTSGSSWVTHDGGSGSLEVGMRADVCVTDRNPFTGDVTEIGSVQTASTFVSGKRVFAAS